MKSSPCSATSQQYFSLRTNQPPATSQQYSSLRTNQYQPSVTSQLNMLHVVFSTAYIYVHIISFVYKKVKMNNRWCENIIEGSPYLKEYLTSDKILFISYDFLDMWQR
jgi:hypothetical protein